VEPPKFFVDLMIDAAGGIGVKHGRPTAVSLRRDQNIVLPDETKLVLGLQELALDRFILDRQYFKVGLQLFDFLFFVLHLVSVPCHLIDRVFQLGLEGIPFIGNLV